MAWTEITRPHYQRANGRYASDLTDTEWGLLAPLMPERARRGRPRKTVLRNVIDALLYIASTGCQWRQLPKDFPPVQPKTKVGIYSVAPERSSAQRQVFFAVELSPIRTPGVPTSFLRNAD